MLTWLQGTCLAGVALIAAWAFWKAYLSRFVEVRRPIPESAYRLVFAAIVASLSQASAGDLHALFLPAPRCHGAGLLALEPFAGVCLGGWLAARSSMRGLMRCLSRAAVVMTAAFLVFGAAILTVRRLRHPAGPNVLLICVDTLRADHLGCYGYSRDTSPHLDALAARCALFDRAFSNAPWTKPSVAAVFTSLVPTVYGAIGPSDSLGPQFITLAEVMNEAGYRTLFFNGGNATIEGLGLEHGFQTVVSLHDTNGSLITDSVVDNLGKPTARRFFAYVQLMDVHVPYSLGKHTNQFEHGVRPGYIYPGDTSASLIRRLTAGGPMPAAARDNLVSLYDGQIRTADGHIGRLLSALRTTGLDRNTLVVVFADHGEELWDHGGYEHGHTLYHELLHVPLIVAGPGVAPAHHGEVVRLVYLAPTILRLVGLDPRLLHGSGRPFLPEEEQGRSHRQRSVVATGTLYGDEKYCLMTGGWKVILDTGWRSGKLLLPGWRRGPRVELYDLTRDPGELHNVAGVSPRRAEMVRALFARLGGTIGWGGRSASPPPDRLQRLRSLGYAE